MTLRSLALGLLVLLMFLQYQLWFSSDGLGKTARLKSSIAAQQASNEKFSKINNKLTQRISLIQHNQEALEDIARNQLGMIKKDETYYQFVK